MEYQGKKDIVKLKDHFSIDTDETYTVLMMLSISSQLAGLVSDLGIYVLKNRTDTEFIFSDSPVVFYNRYYKNVQHRGVLGFQEPGLMIFYPISPDTCILLIDEIVYHGNIIGKHFFEIDNNFDITNINKLQLQHSMNSIYFSDSMDTKNIKRLWRQQRSTLKTTRMEVNVGVGKNTNGNSIGDIVHSFEPQLPFLLNLSFLESEILSDEHYFFRYRVPELVEEAEKNKPPQQ